MFARQVKRKCSVRGCKNTDCFSLSKTRESGNSVIICKSCLAEGLSAIGEINPKTKSNIPASGNMSAPSLFFNEAALGIKAEEASGDTDYTAADTEAVNETADDTEGAVDVTSGTEGVENKAVFVCPDCGKTFDTEKGLKAHMRHCKLRSDEE